MRSIEHQHQVALFQWAKTAMVAHPELEAMYAIPNGGQRNKIVAAKLKAEGVKAGMPDICLPVARGSYHALYVELKAPKPHKSKVQENQRDKMELLESHGNACHIAYGWNEARIAIMAYLGMGVSTHHRDIPL